MKTPKSSDAVLIKALQILARDIQSEDGVANAAIAEGAQRIEELVERLGAAEFPSSRDPTLIEVFYLKDHPPIVCGIHGHYSTEMVESIEKDLSERPEYMEEGNGTYLYAIRWEPDQVGDEGRVELLGYWDLTLVRFQPIEEL